MARLHTTILGLLSLAACDDPNAACLETANWTGLSAEQVTRKCECHERIYRTIGLSFKDRELLATMIRGNSISLGDEDRARDLAVYWALARTSCRH